MGRNCADCDYYLASSRFSSNQWRKGPGYSRCRDCVAGDGYGNNTYTTSYSFQCHQCYREFPDNNQLQMHMQVHRPRTVSCPVCGDQRFKSNANAVAHVESGYCRGCRGRDNARQQIYEFAARQGMNQYMTETPMLTYGSHGTQYSQVPDLPYKCPECNKYFRQMSQLLQHRDAKHSQNRYLGY